MLLSFNLVFLYPVLLLKNLLLTWVLFFFLCMFSEFSLTFMFLNFIVFLWVDHSFSLSFDILWMFFIYNLLLKFLKIHYFKYFLISILKNSVFLISLFSKHYFHYPYSSYYSAFLVHIPLFVFPFSILKICLIWSPRS